LIHGLGGRGRGTEGKNEEQKTEKSTCRKIVQKKWENEEPPQQCKMARRNHDYPKY